MRSTPPRHRPARALFLCLLCLLAPGIAASPAAAQSASSVITVHEITPSPSQPSYLEPLTITVSGVSTCLVRTEGASIGSAADEVVLDLEVKRSCILDPPTPRPFSLRFESPFGGEPHALPVFTFRLRVVEVVGDGETLVVATGPLLTLHRAGQFLVETPDGPPTDDAPFTLRIFAYGDPCLRLLDVGLEEPDVLQVEVDPACAFGSQPESLESIDVEVGPLPAGDYTVRVVGNPLDDGSTRTVSNQQLTVHRADGCIPADTVLCLGDDRFRLTATWRDFQGGTGEARAIPVPGRDDTGMFWFFNENNVELTVKVLNGCGVDGHHWVFVSPGSTTEWVLTVTDTEHDQEKTYDNALGAVPALTADTTAFPTCP